MANLNPEIITNTRHVFHMAYCLSCDGYRTAFDRGAIRSVSLRFSEDAGQNPEVQVLFADGETYTWESKWIGSYITQFGVAVSFDGRYVFAQTWENGLFCLYARTGEVAWRTKSKRGITNIFVNEATILCHQAERALQLLDIHTGEVLTEKRPATAWGFTALDYQNIVCQVTASRWEIMDAQTLETREVFSHKFFTGGHEDYCIQKIEGTGNGKIRVHGFQNVWDHTVKPAVRLPNLIFEHEVQSKILEACEATTMDNES